MICYKTAETTESFCDYIFHPLFQRLNSFLYMSGFFLYDFNIYIYIHRNIYSILPPPAPLPPFDFTFFLLICHF